MPAPLRVPTHDRLIALVCVALVQLGLMFALLSGLRVDVQRRRDFVSSLILVHMDRVARPPPVAKVRRADRIERRPPAAPAAKLATPGGSPGQSHAFAAPPTIAESAPKAPSGGGVGVGVGVAAGAGTGGGTGGDGNGDEGGIDLVQIAGAIFPSDYPPELGERGSGGRVEVLFDVGTNGRVSACRVTRSSGFPELDALTCRLIQQRFRYRPSSDRYGRPVPDEVEVEHDWTATRE